MKFTLTDIEYNENIVLMGDDEKGERAVITDKEFKPYFYTDKEIKKIKIGEHEIIKIEKTKDHYKITVNKPEAVPIISDEIKKTGAKTIEKDIPYTQRYLIDKGLTMLNGVDSETLKKCETKWEPRVIAIDIETTNKKGVPDPSVDEILMISMWSNYGTHKVMLVKQCDEKNTESYPNEKEMLKAFNKTIIDTKPNIIVTYNGDSFDWPFIRDRMNNYKISRPYGYDGSNMTIIKKEMGSSARIKGLAHVDLYAFVSKILSATLKTNTLDLASVSAELLQDSKKKIDFTEFYTDWDNNNMKRIVEYSLKDAKVTYELFDKLKTIIYELAKTTNQPIYEASRASYSTLVENYLINRAHEFNEYVPHRPKGEDVMKRTRNTFIGGYVHEPKPGIYENIAVMDFRSLYPSIIVSYNIGPSTINKTGNTIEVDGKKTSISKETGFIPAVVKDLVETRAAIKKELKKEKNPALEARSYAIKTITNALYGYLSYPRSRWYCLTCAEIITALGRKHIKDVISKAEKAGFSVCYGDTDSAFLTMGNKTKKELDEFLEKINDELPGIMELELERICKRGLFVGGKTGEKGIKKRYALLDENNELIIKGFEFVRGDWSNISKETQYKVFQALLRDNSKEKAVEIVKKIVNELRENKIPLKELVIRTQLTMRPEDYKSVGPHVAVAKRLISKGQHISEGTMISYIVVEGKGLIRDKAKTIDEVENEKLKPDAEYYIYHQVIPTVDRVMDLLDVKEGDFSKKEKGLKDFF